MENVIDKSDFKVIQFTGSSKVSEHLAKKTNGKVRVEDAGFDWKILGPDVQNVDYVTYVSDQDAYGASGQKCSAQSVLFVHENWMKVDFIEKIKKLSERRKFEDLSIGPIISWDNARIKSHIDAVSSLKGAEIAFGGKPLSRDINKVPSVYGLYEPTAVKVPI